VCKSYVTAVGGTAKLPWSHWETEHNGRLSGTRDKETGRESGLESKAEKGMSKTGWPLSTLLSLIILTTEDHRTRRPSDQKPRIG
jgi:hypothetical protein